MRYLLFCLTALLLALAAHAQERRAFIVGVADYTESSNNSGIRDLSKTVNDARAYRDRFTVLGWQVTFLDDPTRDEFGTAFGAFVDSIGGGDEVAFIFSGHGWSYGAENYLTFTDTPFDNMGYGTRDRSAALTDEVLQPLQRLDRARQDRPRLILAVIDACRERPFDPGSMSVGASLGIRPVEPPEGMMVIYSARFGEFAYETLGPGDTSPHSAFSRHFLRLLETPSKPLFTLAYDARDAVKAEAERFGKRQTPAVYAEISRDYCLTGECVAAGQSPEALAWARAKAAGTVEAYRGYIALFGDDAPNAGEARAEIVKLAPSVLDILRGGSASQPTATLTDAGGACGNMLATLYFEYDSVQLTVDSVSVLEEALARNVNCDIASVMLVGHDDTGSRDYAMQIADRRASSVREVLTRYGLDPAMISAQSRGREEPVYANQRSPYNRRVEMQIDYVAALGGEMTAEDFDAIADYLDVFAGPGLLSRSPGPGMLVVSVPAGDFLPFDEAQKTVLFERRIGAFADVLNEWPVVVEVVIPVETGSGEEGERAARAEGELILDLLSSGVVDGADRVRLFTAAGTGFITFRITPYEP